MCAGALKELKVKQIEFSARNDRFGGMGSVLNVYENVKDAEIIEGNRKDEAIHLMRLFYTEQNPNAPNPTSKVGRKEKLLNDCSPTLSTNFDCETANEANE